MHQRNPQTFRNWSLSPSHRVWSARASTLPGTLALCLAAVPIHGQQNTFTQIAGNADQGIVLPQSVPFAPRQDAGALTEIQAFRSAISLSTWEDMQGTGQLTPTSVNSADGSNSYNATIWIRGRHDYRLDVEEPNGTRSQRIDGEYGATQHAGGKMKPMDARDAVAGLVAFPALMQATLPGSKVMLIDHGLAAAGSATFHRITVETPWPGNPADAAGNPLTTVTDLYFNPRTHLLIKSAIAVFGSRPSPEQMLEVVTYGGYRSVNGMLLPHSYRQSLNGQILWTLQLNQVQLNSGLPEADFQF